MHNVMVYCVISLVSSSVVCIFRGVEVFESARLSVYDVLAGVGCGFSALVLQSKPE